MRLTTDVVSVVASQPFAARRRPAGDALPRQFVHRSSVTASQAVTVVMIQVARAVNRALADSPAIPEELTLTLALLKAISINLMVLFLIVMFTFVLVLSLIQVYVIECS